MERWNPTLREIAETREKIRDLAAKTQNHEDRNTLCDAAVLLLRLYEQKKTSE